VDAYNALHIPQASVTKNKKKIPLGFWGQATMLVVTAFFQPLICRI